MATQYVDQIRALLIKRMAQEPLSDEESEMWKAWIARNEINVTFDTDLQNNDYLMKHLSRYQELKELSKGKENLTIGIEGGRTFRYVKFWMAAAALVILTIASYFFLMYRNQEKTSPEVNPEIAQKVEPARPQAILSVQGGKTWTLDSVAAGSMVAGARKTDKSSLNYTNYAGGNAAPEHVEIHTVSTPAGGYYSLTLSDGTRVWMNAASRLVFPSVFIGKERRVRLIGEGFFQVTHKTGAPFLVETDNGTITVLGTEFNTKSYSGETMITTLLQGQVEIKASKGDTKILPGTQVVVSKAGELKIDKDPEAVESATGWRRGLLSFRNASFVDVMNELERWYNVKASYDVAVIPQQSKFNGSFPRGKTLNEVIELLGPVLKVKLSLFQSTLVVQPIVQP